MSATAYPLQWPAGWARTAPHLRRQASFGTTSRSYVGFKERLTVAEARERLSGELDKLGARYVTLSTNLELNLNGQPRSGQRDPEDPGVAVYFRLNGRDMAFACDRWNRAADNIAALAKHIDAMRGMERWGVGTAAQAFAGYEALPAPDPWWKTLGLTSPARSEREIKDAYRKASTAAHPDRPGGSHDRMAAVNAARDEGLKQLVGTP